MTTSFIESALKHYDFAIEDFINYKIEQEKPTYHSTLKNFDMYVLELRKQSSKDQKEFKDSFLRGYEYVLENAPKYPASTAKENYILEPIKPKENLSFIERHIRIHLDQSSTLQEQCGYTNEMVEGIYNLGFDLYTSKDFNTCADVYTFLVVLNPYVCWFWQMLGKCKQMQGIYSEALSAFKIAINCSPHNFEGCFDAVNCCVQAKEFDEAISIIEEELERINDSDSQIDLQEIKTNLEQLKKQVSKLKNGV